MTRRLAGMGLALALALMACGGQSALETAQVVRIAGGPDGETRVLAHVAAALVARDWSPDDASPMRAEVVPFADSRDARQALELGEVDVIIGYTGEAWLEVLGRADPPSDPRTGWQAVSDHDAARGMTWLRPHFSEGIDQPPANATFAFVVQGPPSIDADLTTMSQLAARLSLRPDALVCVDRDFGERPDGLAAVLLAYSVRSDRPFLAADPAAAVLGVAAGECVAGLTTATDGEAWRRGLRPLVDDLGVFPAFVPVPVLRTEVLERHEELLMLLRPMAATLSTQDLGRLNARLRGGVAVEVVASEAAQQLVERLSPSRP